MGAAVQHGYVTHTLTSSLVLCEAFGALYLSADAGAAVQVVSATRTTVSRDTLTLAGIGILCLSSGTTSQWTLTLARVWVLCLIGPALTRHALTLASVQHQELHGGAGVHRGGVTLAETGGGILPESLEAHSVSAHTITRFWILESVWTAVNRVTPTLTGEGILALPLGTVSGDTLTLTCLLVLLPTSPTVHLNTPTGAVRNIRVWIGGLLSRWTVGALTDTSVHVLHLSSHTEKVGTATYTLVRVLYHGV